MSSERYYKYAIVVLALLGLYISISVAVAVSDGGIPSCVGGSDGCAKVEKSQYSEMFGIHISYFGIFGYLAILAASLWRSDYARVAGFVLTMFGFAFSLYLTYLEIWVIKAICQWCVASAVIMTALFVISLIRLVRFYGDNPDQIDSESESED